MADRRETFSFPDILAIPPHPGRGVDHRKALFD
jgi:hypothetical protein